MTDDEFPNRDEWPTGPWDNEPDHEEWEFLGVRCIIHRSPHFGQLNGYVVVPRGHPWFGLTGEAIDTHWGVTWAAPAVPWSEGAGLGADLSFLTGRHGDGEDVRGAHLDALVAAEQWVVGFDTLHAFDSAPGLEAVRTELYRTNPRLGRYERAGKYREWAEVKDMVHDLAAQAAAAAALDNPMPPGGDDVMGGCL